MLSVNQTRKGGRPYPNWLINGFQEVIEECGLIDMEIEGYTHMWKKGRGTFQWVEVRLDRALVSSSWLELYQNATLLNIKVSTSDRSRNHNF